MSFDRIDLTDDTEISEAMFLNKLRLSTLADGTTLDLVVDNNEEIGNQAYRINTSSLSVTDNASNGQTFIYVYDTGASIIAELTSDVPVFNIQKNGWYFGLKKAIFAVVKSGSNYSVKERVEDYFAAYGALTVNNLTVNGTENMIDGSITPLDISPYYNTHISDDAQGSFILKIGGVYFINLNLQCTPFQIQNTIINALPTGWRPASTVYMSGLVNYVTNVRVSINTSGVITIIGTTFDGIDFLSCKGIFY